MAVKAGTRGFTMIDLVVAIIIVGILASLAMPRYFLTLEKAHMGEGVRILDSLRGAQTLYFQETGTYSYYVSNLDVTIPTTPNFNAPTVAYSPLASIARNDASGYSYTLSIDTSGNITCSGTNPANICANLGCPGGACN